MRRLRLFIAGVVALGAGIALVLVLLGGSSFSRAGSTLVDPKGAPLPMRSPPATYHIDYRIDDYAGGKHVITTDRLWVRRPFESLVESWTGRPPGTRLLSKQRNSFGRLEIDPASGQRTILDIQPVLAASDLRVDPVLAPAVASRSLQLRERRRILGRPCQVYRAGGPVVGGTLTPYRAGATEYADACIDEDGLLLEEVWVLDRDPIRRRLATSVETGNALDDTLFRITGKATIDVKQGGGSVQKVDPKHPPARFFTLPSGPPGFTAAGRYALVWPQLGTSQDPSQPDSSRVASIAEIWRRGVDVVIVEGGATLGGVDPQIPTANARRVDLGTLGQGRVVLDLRMSEVNVTLTGGRFLRVYGTLPSDDLVAIARRLVPLPL